MYTLHVNARNVLSELDDVFAIDSGGLTVLGWVKSAVIEE